jgi:hypothetical protein
MPFDGSEISPVAKALMETRSFLERGWCRNTQGKTKDGLSVSGRHPAAVQWCLYGAMMAASHDDNHLLSQLERVVTSALPKRSFDAIAWFNNRQRTVSPVLAVVDRALALALNAPNGPG